MCVSHPSCYEPEEAGGGKEARSCFPAEIGCSLSRLLFLSFGIGWAFEKTAHAFIIVIVEFLIVKIIGIVLSPRPTIFCLVYLLTQKEI